MYVSECVCFRIRKLIYNFNVYIACFVSFVRHDFWISTHFVATINGSLFCSLVFESCDASVSETQWNTQYVVVCNACKILVKFDLKSMQIFDLIRIDNDDDDNHHHFIDSIIS